jgi:hypothetical protein
MLWLTPVSTARTTWTGHVSASGVARVALSGALFGALPTELDAFLLTVPDAGHLLIDLVGIDRTDTPGVDTLRGALGRFARVHVTLPGQWIPAAHLLRAGLEDVARFIDCSPTAGGRERRRYVRRNTRVEVVLALSSGRRVRAMTRNVSSGGLLLTVARAPRSGVHGVKTASLLSPETGLQVDLPALGLHQRSAHVVGGDGRALRLAFDEPCEIPFAA